MVRGEGGGHADVAFVGGRVQTVDAARSWAEAVAVRGGRITVVGSEAEVGREIGPGTEIVDLAGRMLVPGLQDAHVHPVSGGLNRSRCDLTGSVRADAYLDLVRRYAEGHPEREWITGAGWSMEAFPGGTPRREPLDDVIADRPVFLPNRDGHSAWVNSRALELAGVAAETPDPPDGRIERDDDGTPTGTLHEGAMDLVGDLVPPPTEEELHAGLLEAQRYLHSLGITSWQDAIVGETDTKADSLPTYRRAAERGELSARVVAALWWDRHRGTEQIEDLRRRREEGTFGRLRASSVKIMQDGVCENLTAAMLEPYLDPTGSRADRGTGLSFVDPEALADITTLLDADGFQVHFHTIGDRAVREALDAIEAARRRNGGSGLRHHLAHIQIIHDDDVGRFAALGAVANAQPLWAVNEPQMTELTLPFLGEERGMRQYRFRDLRRSGAVLAFGSDWPVSSPDPLWALHVAVNRTPPPGYAGSDGTWPPFLPEQGLALIDALAAATIGAAHVNHLERSAGSIEPGKDADLVVIDRDIFALPPEEIGGASVELTMVEGKVVHDALS